jgi:hypothetical protein
MSTRASMLVLAAMAAVAMSALLPASASAFGFRGAPARIVVSHPGQALGWGYGRGWCYWHPYRCYRY